MWLGFTPQRPARVYLTTRLGHHGRVLDAVDPGWRDGGRPPVRRGWLGRMTQPYPAGRHLNTARTIVQLVIEEPFGLGDDDHRRFAHELAHYTFRSAVGGAEMRQINASNRTFNEGFARAVELRTIPEDGRELTVVLSEPGDYPPVVRVRGRSPCRREVMRQTARRLLTDLDAHAYRDAFLAHVGERVLQSNYETAGGLVLALMDQKPDALRRLLREMRRSGDPVAVEALSHDVIALADEATLRAWAASVLAADDAAD